MDESFTLTITRISSVPDAEYFPTIEFSSHKNYALGLVELLIFNAIPNFDTKRNKIYVGDQVMIIPTGSYEIEVIESYV